MRKSDGPPKSVSGFKPPHCPQPGCAFHTYRGDPDGWPWEAHGLRRIGRAPGVVRQLRCGACGRWFRSSVFGPDYWKKRPGLTARVYAQLLNGSGLRQTGRALRVSLATVRRHARLLARQCLLAQEELRLELGGQLTEEVNHDGLRTFAGSQYEPLELQLPVGRESGFVYDLNAVPLRRSGRMTAAQRARREERDERLGVPEPRARRRMTEALLRRLLELLPERRVLGLLTDEEPDYARALRDLGEERGRIRHATVSSKARRDARNPLWRVNVLHEYARHACRGLVRETIAFPKTAAGLLDRTWIFLVGQNVTKGESEKTAERSGRTPAMKLGLRRRRESGRTLLARRRFPERVGLPEALREMYEGTYRARPHEKVAPYRYKFMS